MSISRFWGLCLLCFSIVVAGCGFTSTAMAADPDCCKKAEAKVINRTDFPVLFVSEPVFTGDAVWMVQAMLRQQGYNIVPDGIFDSRTAELIRIYQLANHLDVNGVVDKNVWQHLMYQEEGESCMKMEDSRDQKRMMIEIDLAKRQLTLYENKQVLKKYPVGIGKSKTPSPLGEWKVVNKGVGWGGGFGTRWMGLNVPWGIYGIHGTDKPYSVGSSESHGCIRMLNKHIEELYPLVPVGTMVRIVENGQMVPRSFQPRILKLNSSGPQVVYLQSRLKEKGIIFDNADGRFGHMTELALRYYQAWNGLQITGIADEDTYRALEMIE
ncbi:MAG TPA: L,D-transpeptidase family protein [Syntrophomonadaceae bacterium]|nr:L,D-transpeptidase family protein [Syntrophomonadaceae bacterium]